MIKLLSSVLAFGLLPACSYLSPYKIDINQGNIIEPQKIAQLQPGMSREQVRYLLGTSMLQDGFNPDRWDYLYYRKPGRKQVEKRHLSLFFNGDRLTRIEGEGAANIPGFNQAQSAPVANPSL